MDATENFNAAGSDQTANYPDFQKTEATIPDRDGQNQSIWQAGLETINQENFSTEKYMMHS